MIKVGEVRAVRTSKSILGKMHVIAKSFKAANDWANQTSQGVDDKEQFDAAVKKRYIYYDLLQPIMADRATYSALATNDDLEDSSADEFFVTEVNDVDSEDKEEEDEEEDEAAVIEKDASIPSSLSSNEDCITPSSVPISIGSKRHTTASSSSSSKRKTNKKRGYGGSGRKEGFVTSFTHANDSFFARLQSIKASTGDTCSD